MPPTFSKSAADAHRRKLSLCSTATGANGLIKESLIDDSQALSTHPLCPEQRKHLCVGMQSYPHRGNCAGISDLTAFLEGVKVCFVHLRRKEGMGLVYYLCLFAFVGIVCMVWPRCQSETKDAFFLHQVWAHTPDRELFLTSRDLGVGNGTSPQLAPDNDRMLENMPVVFNNTDKVKTRRMLNPLKCSKARKINV